MILSLITPASQEQIEIAWIEMHTNVGNFVVQEGHAPMVLILLKAQPCILGLSNGQQRTLFLKEGGIAHIARYNATLITDEIN